MMSLGIFSGGWKTYVAGGLMIAWGVGGLFMGKHSQDQAMELLGEGLAVIHAASGIPNSPAP
jgi:hypothetical protein